MWEIDKEFHFEMGHRVHTQVLNRPHLSITTDCACKNLHGHSYVIKVCLSSPSLNEQGFVLDFKELEFCKRFVDDVLDHKFMLDVNDPNFQIITSVDPRPFISSVTNFTNLLEYVQTDDPAYLLHWGGFVLVNFVPSSENICMYLKKHIQTVLGDIANVSALELWETKKSHCRYSA